MEMSNLQALINGMSAHEQKIRACSQLTLGELIKKLKAMDGNKKIRGLRNPDSYRGYYSDLAFEPFDGKTKARTLLKRCEAVMGKALTGYKGGEYVMGELTPVWVAHYGACGKKLMSINEDGSIETEDDD